MHHIVSHQACQLPYGSSTSNGISLAFCTTRGHFCELTNNSSMTYASCLFVKLVCNPFLLKTVDNILHYFCNIILCCIFEYEALLRICNSNLSQVYHQKGETDHTTKAEVVLGSNVPNILKKLSPIKMTSTKYNSNHLSDLISMEQSQGYLEIERDFQELHTLSFKMLSNREK
ncbi:hypothetical protein PROFUN_02228 [Planoprotostelium fungivorum]|uniref:Uncharacterized protein n=1 Tax=Planoprotostelium fungivorum TaxID=1890364 RepID=A0A2P6NYC2_9EUKA|nr:hypothetical protein PROFUN_02228 [Planoprotostelium fungivorum]